MSNDTELDPTALNGEVLSLLREHHAEDDPLVPSQPWKMSPKIEQCFNKYVSWLDGVV